MLAAELLSSPEEFSKGSNVTSELVNRGYDAGVFYGFRINKNSSYSNSLLEQRLHLEGRALEEFLELEDCK